MIRISLTNVSKKFNLNLRRNKGALEKVIYFISKKQPKEDFWVLRDISFDVQSGKNLGIIGKNGSGKSTLLRIIAGIYSPDQGNLKTQGEVVYVTGFGYGLKPKLTMRENIFLSGSVMGLSQAAIREKFEEVVEFSGLESYLDVKLHKFSSGMGVRLASSIGLHCVSYKNPDVLLIDEVLGTGADIDFQNKASQKIEQLLKGKASVIFVSHNLNAVKKYCNEVLWLDKGKIVAKGDPEQMCQKYLTT